MCYRQKKWKGRKKAAAMKTQRTQSWEATAKYVSGQMYQLSRGRPVITGR